MMSKSLRVVYIGKKHDFQVPITIQIGVGSWQKMNCRPRWFYRKILVSIKKNFTDRFAIWRQNGDAAHFWNQNLKILKISLFLKVGLHSDRSWCEKWLFSRRKFENISSFEELLLGSFLAQSWPGYVRLLHFYFSYTLICVRKRLGHRKSVGERSTGGVGSRTVHPVPCMVLFFELLV